MGQAMAQMAEGLSKAGLSQDAEQAAEKLAGQLSEMELAKADLEAMDMAMDEAMKQLAKLGGQCKGGKCSGLGEGDELKYSDCQGPWRAGDTAGKFGGGSGGPGISGGGMSPEEIDSPVAIEKKMAGSKQTAGPIIGTRLVYGDQVKGEARAEFSAAVESSSKAATEAIDQMLVPRELQPSVKHYFGRLEARAKSQQGGAPKDHAEPAKK
jgi:hypothetical protein